MSNDMKGDMLFSAGTEKTIYTSSNTWIFLVIINLGTTDITSLNHN